MKNIAVILSGCGALDGSEVHEATCTLLALDRANLRYTCLAPNIDQDHVTNHANKQNTEKTRNVLEESARISRCKITDLAAANPQDFDAAIYPGGYGAAYNLSNFALKGADGTVQEDTLNFGRAMAQAGKPQIFICIAPTLAPHLYEGKPIHITVGNDPEVAKKLAALGAHPIECEANDCVIDNTHRIATTPAYMRAKRISEVADGIDKCVEQLVQWLA